MWSVQPAGQRAEQRLYPLSRKSELPSVTHKVLKYLGISFAQARDHDITYCVGGKLGPSVEKSPLHQALKKRGDFK